MVAILSEKEDVPAAYPAAPADPVAELYETGTAERIARDAVSADAVWARLESWVSWRWSPRTVAWIVEGPGAWSPRLRPATITAQEVWTGEGWQPVTLPADPLGLNLEAKTYRITAEVGADGGDPPAEVLEAFRRLAEYFAATMLEPAGVTSLDFHGSSRTAPASWAARAIQYSGAGDLLRRWR